MLASRHLIWYSADKLSLQQMGVAAVVHLYVFPNTPYQQGERCLTNVAVMDDYASLGVPPDPEEVTESARLTRMHISRPDDRERRLSLQQSVRDVVLGSGEIVCAVSMHILIFLHPDFVVNFYLLFQLA